MDNELKKFIEDNIELINNNNWEEVFKLLPAWMRPLMVNLCLNELDIDPFKYILKLYPHMIAHIKPLSNSVTIPSSVDILHDKKLFQQFNPDFKELIIEHSLKIIPSEFFNECRCEQIRLPHCNQLEKIELGAFLNCDNLKKIILPKFIDKSKLYVNAIEKEWLLQRIDLE